MFDPFGYTRLLSVAGNLMLNAGIGHGSNAQLGKSHAGKTAEPI